MGKVEKLCLQDAQHCCSLWPLRNLVWLLCFKISSMWNYWKSLQQFKYGNCSSKYQNIPNRRPFLLSVPTRVRHEKRNCFRTSGLCLRYPRNNSPQMSSEMLKLCSGPSMRALLQVFQCNSSTYGRQMWSWVWKYSPIKQRDSAVCKMLATTGWVNLHNQICTHLLIGKAVICHLI